MFRLINIAFAVMVAVTAASYVCTVMVNLRNVLTTLGN